VTPSFQLLGSPGSTWEMRSEEQDPMPKDNGAKAGFEGIVEDVKGKVKEIIGSVTGRPDVEAEGETQQAKARSRRKSVEHEAKAEAARADATTREAEQRLHQQRKS
jgi:uncharacterized protein YjbJ (UPF0337 family)